MKKNFKVAGFFAALILVAAGVYFFGGSVAPPGPEREEPAEPAVPSVRAMEVKAGTLERTARVTGSVRARKAVEIVPETSGVLEVFHLEEGMEVAEGELVGLVARRHLEARLREAEARLSAARSALEEVRVQLEDTGRDLERMEALYREGVIARREREKAETAHRSVRARLDNLEEQAAVAATSLETARLAYDDHRVLSPARGIVSHKFVEAGSYVSPQVPLARVSDIETVEITGFLAEKYLPMIRPGETRARVTVDAYAGRSFNGVISRLKPEVEPGTRSFEVIVEMSNEDRLLKPGMFARVDISAETRRDVPIVPDAALVGEREDEVLVVRDGVVERRTVTPGLRVGHLNEIIDGLRPGEKVVVRGHGILEEGMEVRVSLEEGAP